MCASTLCSAAIQSCAAHKPLAYLGLRSQDVQQPIAPQFKFVRSTLLLHDMLYCTRHITWRSANLRQTNSHCQARRYSIQLYKW